MLPWLLLTYGITLIVTGARITEPLRRQIPFFKCPMCVAWWVGLGLSFSPSPQIIDGSTWPGHVFAAFASSAWCWIVHVSLVRLGAAKL